MRAKEGVVTNPWCGEEGLQRDYAFEETLAKPGEFPRELGRLGEL